MKKYLEIALFIAGLAFAQPTVELLCPVDLEVLAKSSEKYIDTVFIPNDRVVDYGSDPLEGEWKFDTCYYIGYPAITTCCTFSVHIGIESEIGLELSVPDTPVVTNYLCQCEDTLAIIAGWEQCPFVWGGWQNYRCPPAEYIYVHPDSSDTLVSSTMPEIIIIKKAILNEITGTHWELILPTVNQEHVILSYDSLYYPDTFEYFVPSMLWDNHLEEIVLAPVCNRLGECTDWFQWNYCWYPQMIGTGITSEALDSIINHGFYNVGIEYYSLIPRVICNYHSPAGSLTVSPDSIYTNICSGGCGDSTIYDNRFHFRTDSTTAWMTIVWDSGTDTIHYGDPGTFWFEPDEMSIPWRRFGVTTENTDLPTDYRGEVEVCLQDVTNAPVVRYGDPVHLHPRGVDPFDSLIAADGRIFERCTPSPAEPVCWTFTITGDAIPETEEPQTEAGELALSVSGEWTSNLSIKYSCPGEGSIAVYDILGRAIFNRKVFGDGVVDWSEKSNPTGIYFVRITSGVKSMSKRVVYLK